MEQPNFSPNPSPSFNPGTNKKNILPWLLVIFAALSVVFISGYFLKKNFDARKAKEQNVNAECPFENDQAAYAKAVESSDINTCDCITDEVAKSNCREVVLDLNLYSQAIKQYNPEICNAIKEPSRKEACVKVAESGVAYLKEKDPQFLASVYSNTHNVLAIEEYEKLLQTEPNNAANLLALALAYAEKGLKEQEQGRSQLPNVEKALAAVEKAKKLEPNNPEVYRIEGYVYEIKPEITKALISYGKAIELDPKNILAYAGRGHAGSMLGMLEKALEDLKKAAELDVKKEYISIYANLCRLESSRDDTQEEAIKNCQIVVNAEKADPVFKAETYQILASIYTRTKNYSEAENYLLKAKTLVPNDPNLYVALANLAIAMEKYDEAQADAQKAIALSPTKAASYQALAYALYKQEKYAEAMDAANRGLSLIDKDVSLLAPNKPAYKRDLYYTLANIYNRMGDQTNEMKYKELGEAVFK